jgi:hypothetical protein
LFVLPECELGVVRLGFEICGVGFVGVEPDGGDDKGLINIVYEVGKSDTLFFMGI